MFFYLERDKYRGEVILIGNFNIKDSCNIIKVLDFFFKEIFEIWLEVNYEENIMSDYYFWLSFLWYNLFIRVENRLVFYKDWFFKGVRKVEYLMDDFGKFFSFIIF